MKLFSIVVFTFLLGCSNSSGPGENVSVLKENSQITIKNATGSSIYIAVFECASLSLINWAAICGPNNEIKAFRSTAIPITGDSFKPSNSAAVFWWHQGEKYPGTEYYGPDKLHRVVVKVR